MKIYIAGKVTGLPLADATTKFGSAEVLLRQAGYSAINPMAFVMERWALAEINNGAVTWKQIMQLCLHRLTDCNGVYLLPCWPDSAGANLEKTVAEAVGMPIATSLADLRKLLPLGQ